MADKVEGELIFDVASGKFWVTQGGAPVTSIEFGDTFEVLHEDKWVETGLMIDQGEEGDLIFKLKNTPYSGIIDGLTVRA